MMNLGRQTIDTYMYIYTEIRMGPMTWCWSPTIDVNRPTQTVWCGWIDDGGAGELRLVPHIYIYIYILQWACAKCPSFAFWGYIVYGMPSAGLYDPRVDPPHPFIRWAHTFHSTNVWMNTWTIETPAIWVDSPVELCFRDLSEESLRWGETTCGFWALS